MTQPYRIAVIDPPWSFSDRLPGPKRGAEDHYKCLSFDDLAKLELPEFAEDSIMFMWRVASMQSEALALLHLYGFDLKSEIVWVKEKKNEPNPTSATDLAFGMGHYTRASHETCLIGTRGKAASKVIRNRSIRSVFFAPRGVHSEKPAEFYDLVEALTGGEGPYVDIFARKKHRQGWHFIGDEVGAPLVIANAG